MTDEFKPTFGSSPLALMVMFASIAAYGWQTHGLLIGAGLGLLFLVGVPLLNTLALTIFDSLRLGTIFRWLLFFTIMVGLAVSGSEICDESGNCKALI